ncbi:hypothetical protein EON65_13525 [archaeon]|nr:MAG: hypothetical protein EON65_13525 [archaeon]
MNLVASADLTPAVDKFVRLPADSATILQRYIITARGPVPSGPEPFSLVADELSSLSDYVKELVVSENAVLTMAASHFFEQVGLKLNHLVVYMQNFPLYMHAL